MLSRVAASLLTCALLVAGSPGPALAQASQSDIRAAPAPDPLAAYIGRVRQDRGTPPVDPVRQIADAVLGPMPQRPGMFSPFVAKLQILLGRAHASPGVIDGYDGDNVGKAIAAAQAILHLPVSGELEPDLWQALLATGTAPVLASYIVTTDDVAGPFVPVMPHDYALMAKLDRLAYRDPVELLAERFHMDEGFLRRLNPDADFARAGTRIMVADTGPPASARVARLVAHKASKQLLGYDASGTLVVAYPATIGSSDLPSPTGVHAVKALAIDPEYWYRPKVNFQQGDNAQPLRLRPGPNNPVGSVWIGLDKPTYGIHGTPEPSRIDKTSSHGCVRLTNWDARELARLVEVGVPVEFIDQIADAAPAE